MFADISESLLRKALAEEIKERMLEFDSTNIIPSNQLSPKLERKMRKVIKQYERPKVLRQIIIASKRVASFVIILSALLFTTILSVEALRTQFIEFVITTYEKYSNIFFSRDDTGDTSKQSTNAFECYTPTYIPKDFRLIHEEYSDFIILEYENSSNDFISFIQSDKSGFNGNINTEGVELENIIINGNTGFFYSNQCVQNLIWYDDLYYFHISSTLDKKEIEKIAKSTKFE